LDCHGLVVRHLILVERERDRERQGGCGGEQWD
jgi:hypothetical protein